MLNDDMRVFSSTSTREHLRRLDYHSICRNQIDRFIVINWYQKNLMAMLLNCGSKKLSCESIVLVLIPKINKWTMLKYNLHRGRCIFNQKFIKRDSRFIQPTERCVTTFKGKLKSKSVLSNDYVYYDCFFVSHQMVLNYDLNLFEIRTLLFHFNTLLHCSFPSNLQIL